MSLIHFKVLFFSADINPTLFLKTLCVGIECELKVKWFYFCSMMNGPPVLIFFVALHTACQIGV